MVGAAFLMVVPGPVMAQDNILLATRTQDTITLDGLANEEAWTKAIPSFIETSRVSSTVTVEMRALYDSQNIYISAKWEDLSWSVIPRQWLYTGATWDNTPHKEDRLSMLWNIDDSIIGFQQNKQACSAACHNDVFKTQTAEEKGDLWQWMSGRTNPSTQVPDVGWVDDLTLTSTGVVPDANTGLVWEMNSVYAHDGNESTVPYSEGDLPKWMEGNAPPNPDPEKSFLFRGFETPITDHEDFPDGATLPGYLLSKPSTGQDRADISAKGVYDGTKKMWTLEMKRKLDTGKATDVIFDNLLNSYHFGLAVFDNQAGGKDTHYQSELVTLRFEVPELSALELEAEPLSPIIGDTVNASVKVKNLGGYSTGFNVEMYADDTTNEPIGVKPFTEMLSGYEEVFNFTWDTTGAAPGKHQLIVKVDADDIIAEQDKDNNLRSLDVWVYPPISKFKASSKEPEEGQKIKLTATVANPSNAEANVTVVFYDGNTEISVQNVNVSAGGSEDVVFKWKAAKEGKHTLAVKLQGANNTLTELKVEVKAASPGPGLILAVLAVGMIALVASRSRRRT